MSSGGHVGAFSEGFSAVFSAAHLDAAHEEEHLAAKAVDRGDGHHGGADVDGANHHRVEQGGVGGGAQALEQLRRVEPARTRPREGVANGSAAGLG